MYDIMVLSLFVGGLSGLMSVHMEQLVASLERFVYRAGGTKVAQLMIAGIVSVFDILLANNTVAIVFSGPLARRIAQGGGVPPHSSAAWLDIFSCVFQGIIPYGAQLLLVSSISGASPLAIAGKVYYCYVLGIVTVIYIMVQRQKKYTAS
jgi:Na+/H+ antiporter NhaC